MDEIYVLKVDSNCVLSSMTLLGRPQSLVCMALELKRKTGKHGIS